MNGFKSQTIKQLRDIGVSPPYASQITSGRRTPSLPLALKIYRLTGTKFPPISNATDKQIAALEAVTPEWRAK